MFKKHPLQNRTNVQIKGGGGQRPFEQCSKKLHFFERPASLISTSIKYRRIWCVYLRAEEARVLMCHTNSISNNSFQLLRRYCTMRSLSPRKTIVDENRIITSSVFKQRHHFLRGFQTWLFRPSSCWKTPISSIYLYWKIDRSQIFGNQNLTSHLVPEYSLVKKLKSYSSCLPGPQTQINLLRTYGALEMASPRLLVLRNTWCMMYLFDELCGCLRKTDETFFSVVYLIFRFIGGVWVVKRKCLHV